MKLNKLYFYTLRENVKDEDNTSGNLLVRVGMIKKSSGRVYIIVPMGKRVLKEVEEIVREEMDAADAQELLIPAVIPKEIYEKGGRRGAFGSNMFALKDYYQGNYMLGPTHEELFTMAAMMGESSYKDFPYSLYQIQTEFRDETRLRYGPIRVREFIMRNAYSFDIDEAGLQESYMKMFQVYRNIMGRCSLNCKIVKTDTGAVDGSLSEELQAIAEIGEDVVVTYEDYDFSSNLEITEIIDAGRPSGEETLNMEIVKTPDAETIEDAAAFFQKSVNDFVKTPIYSVGGKTMALLLKGDREPNKIKVLELLQANEMELASFDEVECVTHTGVDFAGPVGLECPIIMDHRVADVKNFIVGANKTDHHIKNVNLRDFTTETAADITRVHEGDIYSKCGKPLKFCKDIEVGNTLKLGTRYVKAPGLEYQGVNNKLHPMEMGCYDFGLERCMAVTMEQHNDAPGIIWPTSTIPFKVAVMVVPSRDDEQMCIGNGLYEALKKEGIGILLDDHKRRPGTKLKGMELISIPYRITVGRGIKDGNVESCARTADESNDTFLHGIVDMVKEESQK